jgi:hypothetical protein
MAATAGMCAVTGRSVAPDILAHLTPTTTAVATAITVTGPMKLALMVAAVTNTDAATAHECSDANYARVAVPAWNAVATTGGAGYGVGFAKRTNNGAMTFFGGTGCAVAQTITGDMLVSSDATPVEVFYENFAAGVSVPINNQYVVANAACAVSIG